MNYDTQAEELLVEICRRHQYDVKTLMARSEAGRRMAEFKVTSANDIFIAGVGEIVPNAEDLQQIRDLNKRGKPGSSRLIGSRARGELRTVALDLREHRQACIPLMVVLYDNVRTPEGRVGHPMYFLEACQIDAAMYGDGFSIPKQRAEPDWHAEGCTMTEVDRTHVSAVAAISDWDDETMFIFHNCFAHIALPPAVFTDKRCHHFEKRGRPYTDQWKWYKMKTSS